MSPHEHAATNLQHPFLDQQIPYQNGKAPISARITANDQRAELAVHGTVAVLEWDPKSQMVIGRGTDAKEINNHRAVIKSKLFS